MNGEKRVIDDIDSEFLEKLIIKGALQDKTYLVNLASVFEPEYFDDAQASSVFKYISNYVDEFNAIPEESSIIHSIREDDRKNVENFLKEVKSVDFSVSDGFDFLFHHTNEYLKWQALKRAMIENVDIIDNKGDREQVREKIEAALSKDLKIDLGLKYFEQLGERLKRIFTASVKRIPTYFPTLDEFISNGFPPFTLSVIVAKIHAGKSQFLANMAARQVLRGHNVVLMTLEMSQDAFAQRFDSIYSLMDINRMYISSVYRKNLLKYLKDIRNTEGKGELFIKQFPTGEASVRDFKRYIRELLIRNIYPDILLVDYINLMKAATRAGNGMYESVKRVAEELRSLSFEFDTPVVSVSQLNREGGFVGFEELDFGYIAESHGIPATADFMGIMGQDEDDLIYESEIHTKIVKNRLGGRVGEVWKSYMDARSLKMYDETELDEWILDAKKTGDERKIYEKD